jgi:hypothetical protein
MSTKIVDILNEEVDKAIEHPHFPNHKHLTDIVLRALRTAIVGRIEKECPEMDTQSLQDACFGGGIGIPDPVVIIRVNRKAAAYPPGNGYCDLTVFGPVLNTHDQSWDYEYLSLRGIPIKEGKFLWAAWRERTVRNSLPAVDHWFALGLMPSELSEEEQVWFREHELKHPGDRGEGPEDKPGQGA